MPESKREIIANLPRLHQYMDRHRLAAWGALRTELQPTSRAWPIRGRSRGISISRTPCARAPRLPRNGAPVVVLNKIAEGSRAATPGSTGLSLRGVFRVAVPPAGAGAERASGSPASASGSRRIRERDALEEVQRELPQLQMVDCVQ